MKIFGNLALLLWSTVYTVVTECVVHASSRRCSGRIRISQPACCTYYVGSMYIFHLHGGSTGVILKLKERPCNGRG